MRGVVFEYQGAGDKALEEYCTALVYNSDWQTEKVAKVRVEQLVDTAVARAPLMQFKLTGIVRSAKNVGNRIARLGLATPSGRDYAIRMIDSKSKKEVMFFYVRGNSKFETKIPLGTYTFLFTHGTAWYGDEAMFGTDADFFKFVGAGGENIRFYTEGNTIHGYSLGFRVPKGNASSIPIKAEDF